MNCLGEMVSSCLTPLFIVILLLSVCRSIVTELSVYVFQDLYLHLLFLVLAMMTILLGFVLSQMPSSNLRTEHTVVCCISGTSL